ncbi:heparinase II/III family protein [Terrabacter sp. GCM10028922]|uniref:heparinase II/III domain-containing protein n=1 Tax=Terrabacter sp. GCM10028922 TaxID=3273428 RepID=UPI00360D1CFC
MSEYVRRFVGPLSGVWRVEKADDDYVVHFPNGGSRRIGNSSTHWDETFPTDHVTSTLWFQSLTYAPYFFLDHGDWETTAHVFSSYASHLRALRGSDGYQPINSLDHAHATQLLAACATMAVVRDRGVVEERGAVLVDFVEAVADSAMSAGMIRHNNHGVMLTRALAHVGHVFDGFAGVARECGIRGAREFDAIVGGAFDADAIVNENTPAYQILWLRLIETMADFTELIGDPSQFVEKWRALLERGKASLGLQLMPGNRVPPIGDDAGGTSPYRSMDGELLSPGNGLYVFKDDDFYVSITSGYRGVVHKHVDDTSIRLQVRGQDLLIDAGLLNYDVGDAVGVSVVSQRGHTGLYFPRFDHLRSLDMFAAKPPRQESSLLVREGQGGSQEYECRYVVDGSYHALRRYTRHGNHIFLIEDAFDAPGGEVAVQRYLLPKEAQLRFHGSTLTARFEGVELLLRFDETATVAVFNGGEGSAPKGWRAARHYEPERCWCVEVEPPAGARAMRASLTVVADGEGPAADVVETFWARGRQATDRPCPSADELV